MFTRHIVDEASSFKDGVRTGMYEILLLDFAMDMYHSFQGIEAMQVSRTLKLNLLLLVAHLVVTLRIKCDAARS